MVVHYDQLRELGAKLHEDLLSDDPTAPARLAAAFMLPLADSLGRRYPRLDDPHLIETAVEDALISYFASPAQYNPNKRSLFGYLRMSANGDLLNMMKRHKKELEKLISIEPVELSASEPEYRVEVQADYDLERLIRHRNSPVWQRLRELLPEPVDQEVILLVMEGERSTDVYADVLGIGDLPADEQATQVKRHKDRIKARLKRNIDPSELT